MEKGLDALDGRVDVGEQDGLEGDLQKGGRVGQIMEDRPLPDLPRSVVGPSGLERRV